MTASGNRSGSGADRTVATHRKAHRDYYVLEKLEAGIELRGTEVKSIRGGHISLNESYGLIDDGQVYIHNLRIEPYEHATVFNHDPGRRRRLLLHQREISRLYGQVTVKGQTLIPLRIYLKHGLVKVELALCKGKHLHDKRETLKRKTAEREAQRAIAASTRRK